MEAALALNVVLAVFSAVSAIAARRKMRRLSQQGQHDGYESPTYAYDGERNIVSQDAVVPFTLGEVKKAGVIHYKRMGVPINNNEVVDVCITLGEGPVEGISNIKLERTDWDNYTADGKGWRFWKGTAAQTFDSPHLKSHPEFGDVSIVTNPVITVPVDQIIPEQTQA